MGWLCTSIAGFEPAHRECKCKIPLCTSFPILQYFTATFPPERRLKVARAALSAGLEFLQSQGCTSTMHSSTIHPPPLVHMILCRLPHLPHTFRMHHPSTSNVILCRSWASYFYAPGTPLSASLIASQRHASFSFIPSMPSWSSNSISLVLSSPIKWA